MAVNIHITIIELNALHTKRQNLFQELDAVIHLLMEAKHRGLRKSRNATRSEERFSRNAETELVCRLLLEKKNKLTFQGPPNERLDALLDLQVEAATAWGVSLYIAESFVFFLVIRPTSRSTLFPYTTLFRSYEKTESLPRA